MPFLFYPSLVKILDARLSPYIGPIIGLFDQWRWRDWYHMPAWHEIKTCVMWCRLEPYSSQKWQGKTGSARMQMTKKLIGVQSSEVVNYTPNFFSQRIIVLGVFVDVLFVKTFKQWAPTPKGQSLGRILFIYFLTHDILKTPRAAICK